MKLLQKKYKIIKYSKAYVYYFNLTLVRARPLNIKEIKEDSRDVLFMDEINNECTILVPKTRKTMAAQGGNPNKSVTFSFDRCYNNKTTTAQMYNEIPYSLVQVSIRMTLNIKNQNL